MASGKSKLLRVGELAKAVGKSVRAVHLYEELGLLCPVSRTAGGFRLFTCDAVDRINWITKLQAIGFSLSEIQGFVREFEAADSGRTAAGRVRAVFQDKLRQIRASLAQLSVIENDLVEALDYLESCQTCAPVYKPGECRQCDHQGHERGVAPELFAGLSGVALSAELADGAPGGRPVIELARVKARERCVESASSAADSLGDPPTSPSSNDSADPNDELDCGEEPN